MEYTEKSHCLRDIEFSSKDILQEAQTSGTGSLMDWMALS